MVMAAVWTPVEFPASVTMMAPLQVGDNESPSADSVPDASTSAYVRVPLPPVAVATIAGIASF